MKIIKKAVGVFGFVAMMGVSASAFSQTGNTGARMIEQLACTPDAECTVLISGAQVGLASCRSRTLVLDINGDTNGSAVYAMLLSAFVSERPVSFFVASCSTITPSRPTALNYRIEPAAI